MAESYISDVYEIKSRLVNVSLIIAAIFGLPMLVASIIKSSMLGMVHSAYIDSVIYLTVLFSAIF